VKTIIIQKVIKTVEVGIEILEILQILGILEIEMEEME
jgi:hypothetical protein